MQEIVVNIDAAYRIGIFHSSAKLPRDIIVKFTHWVVKSRILELFWEQPNKTVDGCPLHLLPDLSVITLQRRNGFKFLTSDLQAWQFAYRWGFPFKLSFEHQTKSYLIRSLGAVQRVHRYLKSQLVAASQNTVI